MLFFCFIFNVKAETAILTKDVYDNTYVYYYDSNLRNFMLIPFDEYNVGYEKSHYLYNNNFNSDFIKNTYENVIDMEFRNSVY